MPRATNYALILAGGRGTRFWPRSRRGRAKQVLELFGRGTMIRQTVDRLLPLVPARRIWVLTNNFLRGEIIAQLPDVPRAHILAEPAQRNTAPAIGLAAHILQSLDPTAVMGVFPADHYIDKPAPFRKLLRAAYKTAAENHTALIGIRPRWPETGYGYVEFHPGEMRPGSLVPTEVVRFREKPEAALARRFVKAGHFCWNAGMFFWRAGVFLDLLRLHLPNTAALIDSLPAFTHRSFSKRLAEIFPRCENISVDYAVLERATGVAGFVAGDIGWNDVGSWNSVYELSRRDADGNTVRGTALLSASSGNLVDAPHKLVALLGIRNLIVVDTPDALLIADRARAQHVGDLVKSLEVQRRDDLL